MTGMMAWYDRLPIHGKLVAVAVVVTTAAVTLALSGLIAVDLWRYRSTAQADTGVLASVIAENSAAAVQFKAPDEAEQILATTGKRESVRRACLYLTDGTLFARFEPARPQRQCPDALPGGSSWTTVTGTSQVVRNQRILGVVYVERELTELWPSIAVAAGVGAAMLVLAGLAAVPIANRLHRRISEPIVQLSAAARRMGADTEQEPLPPIDTGLSEIGELVRAFSDMLRRVADANAALRQRELEREELLRRERDASRLKDEFLAAVSHELRTPLNAIVGWVQILATTTPDQETMAKGIASIARNARTQTRVIEDLVDVSRIVAGKLNMRTDAVDFRDAVEGAVDSVRGVAQAKSIHLTADVPQHPCIVNGDRDRLQQVIGNLLSNAIKFTGAGGTVRLTLLPRDSWFEVSVEDTGVGIGPDFLPFVFDRFRQADGSLTREHGGLGLGLAIVKELTTLHGGTVDVESAGRTHGATFRIRIPALIESPASAVAAETLVSRTDQALAGVRVVAVDDNADTLELLDIALSAAGAQVRTAASGAAALRLLDREVPDVLLCDIAMPDMDGFELLERLRQRDGQADRFVPAIALSAHATPEHRARSRSAGFREHVAKPFRVDAVIQAIRASLDGGPPTPEPGRS